MTNNFYDRNSIQAWSPVYNVGITRLSSNTGLKYVNNEFNEFGGFLYNQNKNYQFVTSVTGSSTSTLSIKLSPPFNTSIVSETRNISATAGVLFYAYANPLNTEYSNDIIKYGATEDFIGSYIEKSSLNEIDFLINGYREFIYLDKPINHVDQPNGWCYETPTIGVSSYNWYFSSQSNVISPSYSILGSGLEEVSSDNPYIAVLINYDYFNLDFNFNFSGGNSNDSINIFLVNQKDLKLRSSWGTSLNSLTASGTFSYVHLSATNIDGTKKYLVFSPSMVGTRTSTYMGSLSNINIVGGYNPLNNLQVLPVNDLQVEIDNSVYTFDTVTNGLTYSLSSKIGNGYFKSGIWENGVWNNGWRDDTEIKDFDDISSSILYSYDISWKIKISGSTYSCGSFKVGDKVAIGNIVAIDINENRKLVRDYYTITDIDESWTWIEVSLDTTFPYRRIEKDSPNHKVKVTKNIWLSGAFFNGYFSGVWNNGLFKGYPKITEMFDTHWIDGFFNGGHFNSNYPNYYFSDISETTNCNYNNVTLVFEDVLSFIDGQPDDYKPGHNLLPGDYITIDKDPVNVLNNVTGKLDRKIYNIGYNGICRVVSVDGNNVVVNKKHLDNLSDPQIGKVTRYTASGLIQNFKFYDTNKSLLKSNESSISSSIFSFNSWIDTNYDTTRSVTLGRDFRSYEPLTGKSFNRNNLYGYPTYDILSSAARFRNSFDLDYGLYKLGTKYKLFNDFIGDASGFNEPFNPAEPTISNFYNDGWVFSTKPNNSSDLAFNRSEAVISTNNSSIFSTSIQDYIDSGVTGNELYLTATYSGAILNNNRITTNKSRYTVVEFDVVTYSIADSKFTYTNQNTYDILTSGPDPVFSVPATQSNSSTNTGTSTASNIFSFNAGQTLGITAIATPGSYDFQDGFNGEVWSVDKQSDGKIIVSGNFTTYDGVSTPIPKLCRINADGTLDSGFNPIINDIQNSSIKFIKVLVVKNYSILNDKIFVLINYNSGVTVNGYSSVLGRTIRLESTGVCSVNGVSYTLYQKEFNGFITDFAIRQTDGCLIVIGNFTALYYNITNTFWLNKIVMFSNTGSFTSNNLYSVTNIETRGFAATDIPSTIVTLNDGTFIVGGKITKFKTNPGNIYFVNGIVKLNTPSDGFITVNTTLVTATSTVVTTKGFTYPTSPSTLPNSAINFINKIVVETNSNKIYVIGNFTSYNDGSAHACYNIVRLTNTGLFDTTFVTGQGLNSSAYDMDLSSDFTKIFVVGQFTSYNSQSCGKVISIRDTGILDSTINDINPTSTSIARTLTTSSGSLVVGGSFNTYQLGATVTTTKSIVTSDYTQSVSILPSEVVGLAVKINLDCTGTDLGNITINLRSPDGKIINIKDVNVGTGVKLTNTIFDISSTTSLSTGTIPYSSGTFSMSLATNKGTTIFGLSGTTTLNGLVTTNAQGTWTIYIQNDTNIYPTLNSWGLIVKYKKYINDTAIEITPSVDLPILHFNNLNYEIGSQPTANGQSDLIYRRMSYLPITQNINHLLVQNSFRFDSIEKTSAERTSGFGVNTIKKKYEYFYNKTDLMMSIQGNGEMGASQSMLVLDNIKMYETDMIPFFKYFEDANIYKGIQVPYEGVAPNIDYLNSDFIFVDNIKIGLDSINNTIIDNNFVCVPNTITIATSSVLVTTSNPSSITETSVVVGGNIVIQGNIIPQVGGVLVGTNNPLEVGGQGNKVFNTTIYNNFSGPVTGLINNTTYYVRAYVYTYEVYTTGGSSTPIITYGETQSFTTVATPPDYLIGDYSDDYKI